MVNGEKWEESNRRSDAATSGLLMIITFLIIVHAGFFLPLTSLAASNPITTFTALPLEIDGNSSPGFKQLGSDRTGIDFQNVLAGDAFLTDAVAHNGSGLALGDVDGDQRVDIYFCGLQSSNKLFRNLGNWKFQEQEIGVAACQGQRSTGAAFVDIDGDTDLDLLVNGIAAGTRLFLNDGTGNFSESENSGLSKTSSATSMALADIDMDGDLDLYCAHYVDVMYTADPTTHYALARQNGQYVVSHVNGEPTSSPRLRNRFAVSPSGRLRELPEFDALYLNMGNAHFKPIHFEKGTFNNQDGRPVMPPRDWSLAVMFRDLNGDTFPDLYVCTDNASPDRVWINNGNGTFRMQEASAIGHTSRSSMGIDFADINRDGLDDFFVADMFARMHEKRMTQLAKQYSDPQEILHPNGRPRYNRNTLFMGQPDHLFVETALMAGVAASDWSWCPVFMDVDLDGFEDLLVTNGFSFDVMDQDSQDQLRTMQISRHERQRSRQFHPPFVTPNAAFRNVGSGIFEPADDDWGFNVNGISNGMALGDLDNDGDQDVVINQLNDHPILLRNVIHQARIKVSLLGNAPNTSGIGARIRFDQGTFEQSQVINGGGRYLSSDEACRVFSFSNEDNRPHVLEVQWPDQTISRIENVKSNHHYTIHQIGATKPHQVDSTPSERPLFTNAGHLIEHHPAALTLREDAIDAHPAQMDDSVSQGLAWQDVNGDSWSDLWVSAERGQQPAIYLNQQGKSFQKIQNTPPTPDDQGTAIGWKDGKGRTYWLVATPHRISHPQRESAIQVFEGRSGDALKSLSVGKFGIGDLEVMDMDGDGDEDLFVATTPALGRYPEPADCQVWINDQGTLRLNTEWSQAFEAAGIVHGATSFRLDPDALPDLALATEWGSVKIFRNTGKGFLQVTERLGLSSVRGWWTDITTGDFNRDGRMDLAATNRGTNTELALMRHASFRIWYGEAIGDNHVTAMTTWKSNDHWYPLSNRTTLSKFIPDLPENIPTHAQFAKVTIEELLGDTFAQYQGLDASIEDTSIFLRTESGFDRLPLPKEAQWSPSYSIETLDANGDQNLDLFLGQNHFNQHSELTRHDGGKGLLILGNGDGSFTIPSIQHTGIQLHGEQRHVRILDFNQDGKQEMTLMIQHHGPVLLKRN